MQLPFLAKSTQRLGKRPPEPKLDLRTESSGQATIDLERQRWRFWLIAGLFAALSLLLLARLLDYQLVQWGNGVARGQENRGTAPRGVIVDRGGELLAADRFFYQVTAAPVEMLQPERMEAARRLEELAEIPAQQTLAILQQYSERHFIELAKTVSLAAGQKIMAARLSDEKAKGYSNLQHIDITPNALRYYPEGTLVSHLGGFVDGERNGAYGLEEYYNAFLDSADGVGLLARTPHTIDDLPIDVRRFVPSAAGKDLVLTIDRTIQWIIEDELRTGIAKYRATGGTIIVMEPKTGAILGMASLPDYDPNHFGEGDFSFERFVNPAISAQFEPGSIFKVITMAAGLDSGVITPTMIFTDSGSITVGGRVLFNSTRTAHGRVTLTEALARSLNVVTAQVADRLGTEQFYLYVRRFGFGEPTEVDLADEVAGLIKVPGDEEWSPAELGTNSFGQGVAVTPMQMINAVAAIANGGKLMRPYLVQARIEHEKVLLTQPTLIRPVMQASMARELGQVMVEAVHLGYSSAQVPGYSVAGKSGTAEIPTAEGYSLDETICSFIGFAPADDPKFVLLVKLDRPDPNISKWANYTAAPMFSQVARRLFDYLNIPPDAVRLGVVR